MTTRYRTLCPLVFFAALALVAASASAEVVLEWAHVGAPGNAADPETGFGAVDEVFRIAKHEVTTDQYAAFLNAVASVEDPHVLWHGLMPQTGLVRSYEPDGTSSYSVFPGYEGLPVGRIPYDNALRFVNWLHNGQPAGPQDATTTEDGAYLLTGTDLVDTLAERRADARFFLPTESEWYKAAYYDPESRSYFDYPTGSDTPPTCAPPSASSNTANCGRAVNDRTPVGSYPNTTSPFGAFDMAGNFLEWTETPGEFPTHKLRSGTYFNGPERFVSTFEQGTHAQLLGHPIGFRVAGRVAPTTIPTLDPVGVAALAVLLLLAARRRLG